MNKTTPRHFLDRSRRTPYPRRHPKPSDWGYGVTVCIAAICNQRREIVSASDFMISTSSFSSQDGAMKSEVVCSAWWAFIAGADISPCIPILDSVRRMLSPASTNRDLADVVDAFSAASNDYLLRERERQVLSAYGLTMDQFMEKGLSGLGEVGFAELRQRIEGIGIDAEFLVCGFDAANIAHIFSVSGRDNYGRIAVTISYHNRPGFFAIGSGQYSALSILYSFEQNARTPSNVSIYNVCAAKFMSETAPGVGKSTWVQRLDSTENTAHILLPEAIEQIRSEWEQHGKPRTPPSAIRLIDSLISKNAPQLKTSLRSSSPNEP